MATVEFRCDLAQHGTPFAHCWEHTVGSCHAPLALRADWQDHLRRCHEDLGFHYVRFHGLLSDDVGTLIRDPLSRSTQTHAHEARRGLLYSFLNTDRIVDFLLSIGMKPFVELSFMPQALASGRETVFKYRGNVTPPRHYPDWSALITRLVAHWVQRYGAGEVRDWFFEVWNEPNLEQFWTGSRAEYFRLYKTTADAIKAVDSSLRVGGPATARDGWIDEFIDYCETADVAVDFVSTHHYPTDLMWNVAADTQTQLAGSRRSLLREWAQNTRRRARGRPVYYTEWNTSADPRDPLHDEPYAAAFVVKTLMEVSGLVEAYSFWTFSDIFEENYFPSVPFHGGFGLMTLHGIPKPTYRAFELLHRLGHDRLLVDGLHQTVDGWVVRGNRDVTVVLTNHAAPGHAIDSERVRVTLVGAEQPRQAFAERIDRDHANPKRAWCAQGSPEYPDTVQLEQLQAASRISRQSVRCQHAAGTIRFDVDLPAHAVAAVSLRF